MFVVKTIFYKLPVLTLLLVLSLTCCAPLEPVAPTPTTSERPWATLARSDLENFQFDEATVTHYDNKHQKRFHQIFGGTSTTSVQNFLKERIHYIFESGELTYLSLNKHVDWIQVTNQPTHPSQSLTVKMLASNQGAQLWLQSLIDEVPISIIFPNKKTITIESPRVGLILIEEEYTHLTAIPRQLTLIHEARHSDCPGGIGQNDINMGRSVRSYADFLSQLQAKKCIHFHDFCETGDYTGLLACDSEPWGPYGIEAVYLEAIIDSPSFTVQQSQTLQAVLIDSKSRLKFDYAAMIQGELGEPDLSSAGLRK